MAQTHYLQQKCIFNTPVSLIRRSQIAQCKAHSGENGPGVLPGPIPVTTAARARLPQHQINQILDVLVLAVDLLATGVGGRELGQHTGTVDNDLII